MNKTNVIVRMDYKLSINNIDRNKNNSIKESNYVNRMIDYFIDDKKRIINMLDYFTGKINKDKEVNLVLENGKYASKEEIDRRKKYINKQFQNSNIWQIIISPDKKFVEDNINWRELELKMSKEILPRVFKKMGFKDVNKIMYQFSLHTNKESHPHFHISFLEKAPNTLGSDNKLRYRRNGQFDKSIIRFIKQEVNIAIEREKRFKPYSTFINKELDEFKKYFSPNTKNFVLYNVENIVLEEKILELGKLLNEREISSDSKIKFGSIKDEQIKELTKEIKDNLFKSNNELELRKREFNSKIKIMNDYICDIGKKNNIKLKDIDLSYTKYKEERLDNYILNAIVNHAKFNYKKGSDKFINSNDVIHSIILDNYKKNIDYSKKEIVHNHLDKAKEKYKMQENVRSAIRNLNIELDVATKEFERLFSKENEKEKDKDFLI